LRIAYRRVLAFTVVVLAVVSSVLPHFLRVELIPVAHAQPPFNSASIRPSKYWGLFVQSSGDVEIDVNRAGIAARVEIPREFLNGVVSGENDTHFVQSDIRNDYYYYSLVDEARHWTYNQTDGPCYKPDFTIYDPNAPWCLEIWNYLNGTFHTFTAPKVIRFVSLKAPSAAGIYNFTLYVASTNSTGYPDFVHAWRKTLQVPVSLSDNPASITGAICDADDPSLACTLIRTKGVVYATNRATSQVAKAYVNETTGAFNVTGLSPGDYNLQASAGIFKGIAYSLSDPLQVLGLQRGVVMSIGLLPLHRAPQVYGVLNYRNALSQPIRSLCDHPYLHTIGFGVLNITVEATDAAGHVFRYQNESTCAASDNFTIITGMGTRYVGLDPYGTEFAGLPSTSAGAYVLTLNVWISGYVQDSTESVLITSMPGMATPLPRNQVTPNPVVMNVGGIISGTIQFWNLQTPETPDNAMTSLGLPLPLSGTNFFGGNIVVEAFDQTGIIRGLTVINGTFPDGTTIYHNLAAVPFYIFGFSEYYNRTWSGTWGAKDYGLLGGTYSLLVLIRGYELYSTNPSPITVGTGGNSTAIVRMTRGGAMQVTVGSYDNLPGTLAIQAAMPWRFLTFNLSIPIRARLYFYDWNSNTVGYVEWLMTGNGVTTASTFQTNFAGQNWSLRDIWFYGRLPTHFTNGNYTVRAFTLGYIQPTIPSVQETLAGFGLGFVTLFIADEVDLTVPIFADANLFGTIPEHAHSIGQVISGVLWGAVPNNVSAGTALLDFQIYGFGATVVGGIFNGQGHFFYVAPDGTRYFDYGLAGGPGGTTYIVQMPEFGFLTHFMQISPPTTVTFNDLFLEQGIFLRAVRMASVYETAINSYSGVTGWVAGMSTADIIPLSWVQVSASNSTFTRFTSTVDGSYDGVEALFLPAGNYVFSFSIPFYNSQTTAAFSVNWSGIYSLLPPNGPLCPIADPSNCLTPSSPSPSPSHPRRFTSGSFSVKHPNEVWLDKLMNSVPSETGNNTSQQWTRMIGASTASHSSWEYRTLTQSRIEREPVGIITL
jgi:hypothetical protein